MNEIQRIMSSLFSELDCDVDELATKRIVFDSSRPSDRQTQNVYFFNFTMLSNTNYLKLKTIFYKMNQSLVMEIHL